MKHQKRTAIHVKEALLGPFLEASSVETMPSLNATSPLKDGNAEIRNFLSVIEGTFWLLGTTPPNLLWPAVLGFGAVVLGYSATIIRVVTRPSSRRASRSIGSFDAVKASLINTVARAARDRRRSSITSSTAKLIVSLAESESPGRKRLNVCLKIGDLMVESVLLFTILEAGPPVLLAGIFTTIVVTNALSCVIMIYSSSRNAGLTETLVDFCEYLPDFALFN
ncbi:hypothetical protein PF007_g19112 [Phytophthora fragariae]|uniref:Uncharacterized protein n=1 Tax=Phytophthora fragariae TaxID=53985 RepID=A0A6A3RCG1_9STRA|nr:hypothetical protein PF007_g19112 [Phytophthora fragariae]